MKGTSQLDIGNYTTCKIEDWTRCMVKYHNTNQEYDCVQSTQQNDVDVLDRTKVSWEAEEYVIYKYLWIAKKIFSIVHMLLFCWNKNLSC